MSEKVLLFNPPGRRYYIRDYYCSKVAKGSYIYQPTDLVIQSGIIAEKYDVIVLDAMVEGMNGDKCLSKIGSIANLKAIVSLAGAVSWDEDRYILEEIKSHKNIPVVVTGDIFLEEGEEILKENPFLDAILLDFTNRDAISYIEGREGEIKNMIYRKGNEFIKKTSLRSAEKEYEIPIPRHELFIGDYNYPFVRHKPFATVLTDYGCPYTCSFCVIGTLGFKCRPIENVMNELRYLKSLGYKEIYFNDQTFGVKKLRAKELCNRIVEEKLNFGWVCWSRVDVIDEELIKIMKNAGCHTILFGVETTNEKALERMGKGYNLKEIEAAFKLCRDYGIRTLATYILGLPGEDKNDIIKSIEFAIKLDSDFVSFNTLIPRAGTQIRKYAVESGWITDRQILMDQSGTYTVMGNGIMSGEEILKMKNYAVRRFYRRPSYIMKRLLAIRTLYEFKRLIADGKEILYGGL